MWNNVLKEENPFLQTASETRNSLVLSSGICFPLHEGRLKMLLVMCKKIIALSLVRCFPSFPELPTACD